MRLLKSVDEKLYDIGFVKKREDKYGVIYQRYNAEYNYTQNVSILYKKSGRHILQSYDPELIDEKKIGNCTIGLTGKEMKLFIKKMKKIGLYS